MDRISEPRSNYNDPDFVLAQSVAANTGWHRDGAGAIYDADGTMLAQSLGDLGIIMRRLGWFAPKEALASGIAWKHLPDDPHERSATVRRVARELDL